MIFYVKKSILMNEALSNLKYILFLKSTQNRWEFLRNWIVFLIIIWWIFDIICNDIIVFYDRS